MKNRKIRSKVKKVNDEAGLAPHNGDRQSITTSRGNVTSPTLRLANQIRDILTIAIPNSGHPLLASFVAGSVEHHGIGPNFIVQVYSENRGFDYDPVEIKAALEAITLKLRFEVAKIAARRNTPSFEFDVLPPGVQSR